ncbi:uncharacterized protein LOC144124702 [Amblyomma americanum]
MESHAALSTTGSTGGSTATGVALDKEPDHSQRHHTPGEENAHWHIALIGCAALVFCTAVFCTSGLFYVYFMEAFGVNRETASWPATTMGAVTAFSGLVVALLQRFLTVYEIGLIGSVLLWAGVIASAFVPRMELMTLYLGAVQGLGNGLIDNTMAVTIGTFFWKHRGLAMGVKDSGRTLSALIFPSVVSKLNSEYGFRGALAICGALLINVTALMLMLRRPLLRHRGNASIDCGNSAGILRRSVIARADCKPNATRCQEDKVYTSDGAGKFQSFSELRQYCLEHSDVKLSVNDMTQFHRNSGNQPEKERTFIQANDHFSITSSERDHVAIPLDGSDNLDTQQTLGSSIPQLEKRPVPEPSSLFLHNSLGKDATTQTNAHSTAELSPSDHAHSSFGGVRTLLADPRFYALIFQNTVMSYWGVLNRSIGVDYALDKGVATKHAELVGTYAAATDLLLGHVAIPLIADRGYLKRSVLAALAFALMSATLVAITFVHGTAQFLLTWITASFLLSATVSFSSVLIADCLGADRVPVTWGTSGLVTGPLLLATPSITGFFRDTMGSYDNLVRLTGGLAAVAALLVLSLPALGRRNDSLKGNNK